MRAHVHYSPVRAPSTMVTAFVYLSTNVLVWCACTFPWGLGVCVLVHKGLGVHVLVHKGLGVHVLGWCLRLERLSLTALLSRWACQQEQQCTTCVCPFVCVHTVAIMLRTV